MGAENHQALKIDVDDTIRKKKSSAKKKLFFATLILLALIAIIAYASQIYGGDHKGLDTQSCRRYSHALSGLPACAGTYPNIACGNNATNSSDDRMSCNDAIIEFFRVINPGNTSGYLQGFYYNTSVNNCGKIIEVDVVIDRAATSAGYVSTNYNCNTQISNGTDIYSIDTSCPAASGVFEYKIYNVTANLTWDCSMFFGSIGANNASINYSANATAAVATSTFSADAMYFNVSFATNPNVTALTETPDPVNFSSPINISATILSVDAIDKVILQVNFSNGTFTNYSTTLAGKYYNNSVSTRTIGNHSIRWFANTSFGTVNNTAIGLFEVNSTGLLITSIKVQNIVANETSPQAYPTKINISMNITGVGSSITGANLTISATGFNLTIPLSFVANISASAIVLPSAYLGAGNYTLLVITNNSAGDVNNTEFIRFNITQGTDAIIITSVYGDSVVFPNPHNFTRTIGNTEQATTASINGTAYVMGSNISLGAMLGWTINVTASATMNWTPISAIRKVNVTQASASTTLTINETSPITHPIAINITGSDTNPEATHILYINGVDRSSQLNQTIKLGAGTYNISLITPSTQNYSFSSQEQAAFIVNRQASVNTISLLPNGTQIYGTLITATGTTNSEAPRQLFIQGTNHTINDNIAKPYAITASNFSICSYQSENYTTSCVEASMTINALQLFTDFQINNLVNQNVSYAYPQNTQANASANNGTASIFRDSIAVANPDNQTLGVATYLYKANVTAPNANFTGNATGSLFQLMITQGITNVDMLLNNARSNVSITIGNYVSLKANATNTQGNLSIYVNGTLNATGTSVLDAGNYNFTTIGVFNITAIYFTAGNYTGDSETWYVNVSADSPPSFTSTSPANQTRTTNTSQLFIGNVTDDINLFNITFYWNGIFNVSSAINGTSNGTIVNISNLAPSNNTWQFVVCDTANQCASADVMAFEVYTTDTSNPNLVWNMPLNNSVWNISSNITFDFNVSDDNGLVNLSIFINGLLNATTTSLTNNLSINQSMTLILQNGVYNVSLRATDTSNNQNNTVIRVLYVIAATTAAATSNWEVPIILGLGSIAMFLLLIVVFALKNEGLANQAMKFLFIGVAIFIMIILLSMLPVIIDAHTEIPAASASVLVDYLSNAYMLLIYGIMMPFFVLIALYLIVSSMMKLNSIGKKKQ